MITKTLNNTLGLVFSVSLGLTLPLSTAWAECHSVGIVGAAEVHLACTGANTIILDQAATFFTHNPGFGVGFNTNADWDPNTVGDQTLTNGALIVFDDLGSGNNQITIGGGTLAAASINGTITITAGTGNNQLTLDSSANTTDNNQYNVDTGSIMVGNLRVNPIANFQSVSLLTGGTPITPVVVHATTSASSQLNIQAAQSTSSIFIDIPNAISAPVNILNTSGQTSVFLNNASDVTNHSVNYNTSNGQITGYGGAGTIILGSNVRTLGLTMGAGVDTLNMTGTAPAVVNNNIDLGDGANVFQIAGSAFAAGSTNTLTGGSDNDTFNITSAVPAGVTAITIDGGAPTMAPGDVLNYTAGPVAPFPPTPAAGTMTPTAPNTHAIVYTSIEGFGSTTPVTLQSFKVE